MVPSESDHHKYRKCWEKGEWTRVKSQRAEARVQRLKSSPRGETTYLAIGGRKEGRWEYSNVKDFSSKRGDRGEKRKAVQKKREKVTTRVRLHEN